MADTTDPTQTPIYRSRDNAPFVVFDGVVAHGVMNGAVQIELASRTLIPQSAGELVVEFVAAGHLRCSPASAVALRDALDSALKMLQQPPETGSRAATLN